jgi:alkanesulfonate monooxygenase SsuD/methylene tetrahydromethanopterin reductase-like flavin-dependent oxidoreductase (luciferase family)
MTRCWNCASIADEGGMHAIWTGEHHGMNFTIAPNPLLNLVDLARRTKNVRLGTGTVIAPVLASDPAGGRGGDGRHHHGRAAGPGHRARRLFSFEYERLMPGLDAWGAGGRMRELIPAIKALWAGRLYA